MGQGTTPPPTTPTAPAAPATAGTPPAGGMSPQQAQAIAMLLGQMGKRPQIESGMAAPTQQLLPTQTIQGGSYFNPNKQ